jgi:hypothetical protein
MEGKALGRPYALCTFRSDAVFSIQKRKHMQFFHSSNEFTGRLLPMVGENRHPGEAAEVIDKPAVWLSTHPMVHTDSEGKPRRFRYKVEVPIDDSELREDKPVGEMGEMLLTMLGGGDPTVANRYFYLLRPVLVSAAEEWSLEQDCYVPTQVPQNDMTRNLERDRGLPTVVSCVQPRRGLPCGR